MSRYPLAILLFLLCFIFLTTSAFPLSFKKTRAEAIRGDSRAQYEIGVMYAKGEGVKRDRAQAIAWLEKAAAQGHAEAKRRLKSLLQKCLSTKIPSIYPKGIWWHRLSSLC